VKLYHRTDQEAAAQILKYGFRDGKGTYMTKQEHSGVWLSNVPLDENEGAFGDVLLELDLPDEKLTPYEWIEEGKPYREFLVPAGSLPNSKSSRRTRLNRPDAIGTMYHAATLEVPATDI
jgi:hypothetical protein